MILGDFLKALGQLGDPRFRRVTLIGVALALALLAAIYAVFVLGIEYLTPESIDLPWIGPVTGVDTLLDVTSFFLMIGLSVFLMVPVASAFTGIFLEDIVRSVEDRHYPALPPATGASMGDTLRDTVNFLGLIIGVNVLALFIYPFAGPAIPLVFWAINGFLLGREYFTLVALRRIGRTEAKAMRRRNRAAIWAAGTLMAAPLSIPFVNLIVPVLGVATFTHLFHRLAAAGR
ncbi:EI24 domain-containing protein [Tabrizicola sp. BL-A-41-H6]|uniref:EI24 domain-containing protein n=1 Tax=Tabrizicola sp. BL-A-41-H6 TaxID=3421107 RepID=UPI003D66FB1D